MLGRSGEFDGDAVLDILLAQPQTAEFIVSKLWREFVSPNPDPAEVKRIARMFRDNRYNIKVALRALLISNAFYAPQNRAALIKSPVELIVGTLRQFRFETGEMARFFRVTPARPGPVRAAQRQGLAGGEAWINSATLLAQAIARVCFARVMRPAPIA